MNELSTPIVSVSITTYQHAEYIRQCLDSVLMQKTNFPIEILLGEDESMDGTREICMEYAELYPETIKLFLRNRVDVCAPKGYPTGRYNYTQNCRSAKGKYIALLEGDDYWIDPLKLQKQVDILEKNDNIICCHHWQKIAVKDENGCYQELDAPKDGYYRENISTVKDIFENKMRVKTRTIMFRNIIQDSFFPKWYFDVAFGDVPLSFLLGRHGDFYFIDEAMAVYRQTGKGLSQAGLNELGSQNFLELHYKYWIEIWDYADLLYDYKYHNEVVRTVNFFILKIVDNTPSSLGSLISLLFYNMLKRKCSVRRALPHTRLIFKLIRQF